MPPRRTTQADLSRWARRGTTTQRGLGSGHQTRKRQLMAALLATGPRPCRKCGHPLIHPDTCCPGRKHHQRCDACRLDLGHGQPRALGGDGRDSDLEHAWHNRGDGARLRNAMYRQPRRSALPRW